MTAPLTGAVGDWIVTSGGRFFDLVTHQFATITGNGGVLPNTRLASSACAGMRGFVADFTNAVTVTVPTTGWSASAGTVVCTFVPTTAGNDGAAHGFFEVPSTSSLVNIISMDKNSANNLRAIFFGADGSAVTTTQGVTWASGTARVAAISWSGTTIKGYDNATASTPVTTDAANALADSCYVGYRPSAPSYFNWAMQRFTVYPRLLTDAELTVLNASAGGCVNTASAIVAAGWL